MPAEDEVLARLDMLIDLFQRRLQDDRVKARALDELASRLRSAEAGPFREYLQPFVRRLALALDRLDRYEGPDHAFAASIRDELLDALSGYGVTSIEVGPGFDPALHEAVGGQATGDRPGTVLQEVRRGLAYGNWVFRPAQVVVATAQGDPDPPPDPGRGGAARSADAG